MACARPVQREGEREREAPGRVGSSGCCSHNRYQVSRLSPICMYLPTVLTYCIYIPAFYSVHTARSLYGFWAERGGIMVLIGNTAKTRNVL